MLEIEKHMNLLGMKAEDKVTGLTGVITCVSFDLYGCVQVVLTPKAKDDGVLPGGSWMDTSRLNVLPGDSIIPVPNYEYGTIAKGDKGPAEKPVGR